MPLNSPEDYARLGEHLQAVDPLLAKFCREHGFAPTGALGRYPRRRIGRQAGEIQSVIDLQMESNAEGERFDDFFPAIPYSLFAGCWIDRELTRYSTSDRFLVEQIPFNSLVHQLPALLGETLRFIDSFSVDSILSAGRTTSLPPIAN